MNQQTRLRAALRLLSEARDSSVLRRGLYRLTKHRYFERFTVLVIILNVLVMVQFRSNIPADQDAALDNLNFAFSIVFCVEMLLKFLARPASFFREGTNTFDFCVVAISIALDAVNVNSGGTAFRALRVIVLTRLFHATAAFNMLFEVFYRALPMLLNVGSLSVLIFFMYSVLGLYLFGAVNNDQGTYYSLSRRANFANFGHAMLTLFRVATGDDWSGIMYDAMVGPPNCSEVNPNADNGCGTKAAYAFFFSFSVVGQWILLNLFIASARPSNAHGRTRTLARMLACSAPGAAAKFSARSATARRGGQQFRRIGLNICRLR